MSRRGLLTIAIAGILAVAVTAVLVIVWFPRSRMLTAADETLGTVVRVDHSAVQGRGAELRISAATESAPFTRPSLITPVSEVVRVELTGARLVGAATISMNYPANVPADDLFLATYVKQWGQWVPLGGELDTTARTISVRTAHLSDWVVASWNEEETEAQAALILQRNITANRYAKGVAGLLSMPPPLECRYQALPVRVELKSFVPGLETCVRFHPEQKGKFQLSIGNTVGYPLLLDFPAALTVESATNGPQNIYTALIEDVRALLGDTALVLGAGQRVTFLLDPAKLPDSSTVTLTARLDFGHAMIDITALMLQLLLPLAPESQALALWRKSQKYLSTVQCILNASVKLAKQINDRAGRTLARWVDDAAVAYYEGVFTCANDLVAYVLEFMKNPADAYVKGIWNTVRKGLGKLLKRRLDAVVAIWKNSGALRGFYSGMMELVQQKLAGNNGLRQLTLTVTDPPLARLHEVIPRPGEGTYRAGLVATDYLIQPLQSEPYIPGRNCPDEPEWPVEWAAEAYGTGYLYLGGGKDLISVNVRVGYVLPGHRAAMQKHFDYLRGYPTCTAKHSAAEYTEYGPVVTAKVYPANTLVWDVSATNPDYSTQGVMWWGYDAETGYLFSLQVQPYDSSALTIGEMNARSETAWYYLTKRAEAMLNTRLAPTS